MAGEAVRAWPREYAAAAIILTKAADFAEAEGRSPWDFAVELGDLLRLGLSKPDLRWLICRGWVEHAEELVGAGSTERIFRPTGRLTICQNSCFVLTANGRAAINHSTSTSATPPAPRVPPANKTTDSPSVAPPSRSGGDNTASNGNGTQHALDDSKCEVDASQLSATNPRSNGHSPSGNGAGKVHEDSADANGHAAPDLTRLKPVWDAELNRLTLGDMVVKEYRTPAPNQQRILAAFQEEDWPVRVDDPLPPHPDQDPKRRLHETIVSLNRNQKQNVLHFSGDGRGEGVRWQAAGCQGNWP